MAGQIINRRKNVWVVRVFAGRDGAGKRTYVNQTVRGTKKQADAILTELMSRRNHGQLNTGVRWSLNSYFDFWLKTTVAARRARTRADYRYTLDKYVRPYLRERSLSKLSSVEVKQWLAALKEQDLAPRTIRKAHEVLRNALEQAVTESLEAEPGTRQERVQGPPVRSRDGATDRPD